MKIPFFSHKPLVSVILPSFNHATYVAAAVRSVLDQSVRDLELIVVDDGSSDTTPDVVAAIHDPRLKLIRMRDNRAVHVRNLALSQARGRYIAFQNSDDLWQPGKLAAQLAVMEAQTEVSACFTGVSLINADGQPAHGTWADNIFTTENRPAHRWLRHFFDVGNCLSLASAMVRREEVVKLGGFRASLVQLGDFDLWIQLAALGSFCILPAPLTSMRILENINLSGPSESTARRTRLELVTLLARYAEEPILSQLGHIFPDLPAFSTTGANKVALAQYAWTLGGVFARLADSIISQVMENPAQRADSVAAHGSAFVHTFLKRRTEYEFVWHA